MRMRFLPWTGTMVLLASLGSGQTPAPFEADWESLAQREPAPEWFRDAKFGISFLWGVYSVPAFGNESYSRTMHMRDQPEYQHHLTTYGDPTTFGYHDFVPRFRAENFDANAWADLAQKAGARFAGPVAEHHDGFAMWASLLTPWNAGAMGPQRDITGELEKAIRARSMKFLTTLHHARNNLWQNNGDWTGHYEFVKKQFPSLLDNPTNAILYGYLPRPQFLELWKGKLLEVIDRYQPDFIGLDSWLDEIPALDQADFLAYYFNHAAARSNEVVVACTQLDLPREVGVQAFKSKQPASLTDYVWLAEDTIGRGSGCYTLDLTLKSTVEILHSLIDIVSQNGVLLLHIAPMADGTIPENQEQLLLDLGAWLRINGEAVYATRPWLVSGEGPAPIRPDGASPKGRRRYSARDVRFTRSQDGHTLYAIALGWPEGQTLILTSPRVRGMQAQAQVRLLGHGGSLPYSLNNLGQLTIHLPVLDLGQRPGRHAYTFKLEGFTVDLQPQAQAGR